MHSTDHVRERQVKSTAEHSHSKNCRSPRKMEGRLLAKKVEILGNDFMETEVGKCFKDGMVKMIANRKTGCKNVSFKLCNLELLGG